MGCCESKSDKLARLKPGGHLYRAQLMKMSINKMQINQEILKKGISQKQVETFISPKARLDFKILFTSPEYNEVTKLRPYLYLSGIPGLTQKSFEEHKISLIINATVEWPKYTPVIRGNQVVNFRVPVDDTGDENISIYFDEVADKILENRLAGGVTLVHCMAGASRSTTLVLAYLVKYERMNLYHAFRSVRKRRSEVRPNLGFWDQLIKYEIKIKSKSSVAIKEEVIDGIRIRLPEFYQKEFFDLYTHEREKQLKEGKDRKRQT